MSDTLSPAEIAAATGKRRPATQAAVLARRGVPFRYTPARVIVERAVALAHELLPRDTRGGVDLSKVR